MAFPHDGNKFKEGTSGNPNGRPPKLLSHIVNQWKSEGFEAVSPAQVLEAYTVLINVTEGRIKEIVGDQEAPMFLRIVGKAMLSNKGTDMIEKMLERAYGKATQPVNHSGGMSIISQYVHQPGNEPLNDE